MLQFYWMKKFGLCCLLFCGFLAGAGAAQERSDWKMLVRVKGRVETRLASQESWRRVFSSRLLKNQKDMVKTGESALAQLRSSDGSAIRVGPKTELTVAEFNPEAGRVELKVQNLGGSLRAKVGELFGGERRFRVVTPNSVLSARGTEFIVVYNSRIDAVTGEKVNFTTLDVLHGVVETSSAAGASRVLPGQRFQTDGTNSKVSATPPDFQGVPRSLVPLPKNTRSALQRGTMSQSSSDRSGAKLTTSGGVYLNPRLPTFTGAATAPVQVDVTVGTPGP